MVPAIALYATPSSVCSAPHQINSHDLDVNGRPPSSSHKPLAGGLSRLFSPASYSAGVEDRHDRPDELGSSSRYSSSASSSKREHAHQSPVSVFQGPNSSRSPPFRISADMSSIRSGSGIMFNGFVRHALGSSCVDYDSSNLAIDYDSFNLNSSSDELTFNMDDTFTELGLPEYARELLSDAQSRHLIFRDDLVVDAFCEAERAHRGQKRASGHPYLQHCVETAMLLADIGANSTVVAAGLLHDTVDDSFFTHEQISRSFGAGVSDLVQGVSKLSQLSKLARENNTADKTIEADRLHTMFLAIADARAVLIKLADRLHNMITLDALPLTKQQRFAKETSEIFVPLANRLGISTWKERLENLCFKHLNPDEHHRLSSQLVRSFDEAIITSSIEKLEQALMAEAISYHSLSGRHKSLFSIYSKMSKKKVDMDKIHDIHGLRLIVETEEDCYKALKTIRQLWREVPERFKDYIAHPKCNGYQSLHTVLTCEGMVPLEIQIRTKKMHMQAEYGFAAHWRYKEGDCKYSNFVLQMVEWARWVITWQCEAMTKDKPPCVFPTHSNGCTHSCKPQCSTDGPVFVIIIENDKMCVEEFVANSTVMDVLDLGGRGCLLHEEIRTRLNDMPVRDPTAKLKMGDVVELIRGFPDKSLTEYREEIQRMYNRGITVSGGVSTYI